MKQVILVITAIFISLSVIAQEPVNIPVVEKSKNKVKIDGKNYYIHIVQSGETLYAISKAYDVSQSEIAISNPDIYAGLKVGQALKIPAKATEQEGDDKYIYHIVKKSETLFGLSRQYNVPVDEIIKVNPEVKEGLQVSQVVLIPKKLHTPEEIKPATDTLNFIMHEVQPKEGLFAISRRYGVDPKEIEFYNKDVLADGVKLGTTLRIPIKPKVDSTSMSKTENITESLPCKNEYEYNGQPFNISLFLPFTQFEVTKPDTLMDDTVEQPTDTKPRNSDKSKKKFSAITQATVEFYEGFLMAIDSLKKDGVSINLSVYDTKRSKSEVENIIKREQISKSDLIISPFFIDELLPVADLAKEYGINMISPLYSGPTVLPSSSNVFEINQSFKKQLEIFVKNFELNDSSNYIVVYDKENMYSSAIQMFDSLLQQKFDARDIKVSKFIHQTATGKSAEIQDSLSQLFIASRQNVVIIPSEDEPFVSEFLGHIYGLKSFYNLNTLVYGFARWQKMKNIPTEYLYKLNLHLFTPFYVDYQKDNVKHFVADYRELFRAEPSQYSFLGYDIGIYFLSALKTYGVHFNDCISSFKMNLLQSNYSFQKNASSGIIQNSKQVIINYTSDYDIVRIK